MSMQAWNNSQQVPPHELLRMRGMRVTPQRLVILEFLLDSKEHPTAETIYEAVRELHPTMSLNTVYKNLDAFESAGLILKLNIGAQHKFHYDGTPDSHPHLLCVECGRVLDAPMDCQKQLRSWQTVIAARTGFDVYRTDIQMLGLCAACREGVASADG